MSSAAFALDHLSSLASEKLCYVHCSYCDTVLAVSLSLSPSSLSLRPLTLPLQVSVPCSSLFKTVTVRCGHCTNLLSVNMRALLLPTANQYIYSFLIPPHSNLLVRSRLLIVLVLKVFKVSERTGRALTSPSAVASGAASDCTKPDDSAAEGNAGDKPDPDG